jgi:hypothetical protein
MYIKQVEVQCLITSIIRIRTHFVNALWYYSISKESRHTTTNTHTTASIAYLIAKNMKARGTSSRAVNFQIRRAEYFFQKQTVSQLVLHFRTSYRNKFLLLPSSKYHSGSYNEPVTSNQTASISCQTRFNISFPHISVSCNSTLHFRNSDQILFRTSRSLGLCWTFCSPNYHCLEGHDIILFYIIRCLSLFLLINTPPQNP